MQKKVLVIITLLMPTKHYMKTLGIKINSKNIQVKYWNILSLINYKYFKTIENSKILKKNKNLNLLKVLRNLQEKYLNFL